jgi:hypothetical protein
MRFERCQFISGAPPAVAAVRDAVKRGQRGHDGFALPGRMHSGV